MPYAEKIGFESYSSNFKSKQDTHHKAALKMKHKNYYYV